MRKALLFMGNLSAPVVTRALRRIPQALRGGRGRKKGSGLLKRRWQRRERMVGRRRVERGGREEKEEKKEKRNMLDDGFFLLSSVNPGGVICLFVYLLHANAIGILVYINNINNRLVCCG